MHLSVQSLSGILLFVTSWSVATRLLCPWNFPGKNTRVGCHFLIQGTFPTQESYLHLSLLLHWQVDSLPLHLFQYISIYSVLNFNTKYHFTILFSLSISLLWPLQSLLTRKVKITKSIEFIQWIRSSTSILYMLTLFNTNFNAAPSTLHK